PCRAPPRPTAPPYTTLSRSAQLPGVGGVDREQAAEHHRLNFLVAGERLDGPAPHRGDRVADAGLLDFLDLRGDEADLARAELGGDRPSARLNSSHVTVSYAV